MTPAAIFLQRLELSNEGHGHMNRLRGGELSSPICPKLQTHDANFERSGKCRPWWMMQFSHTLKCLSFMNSLLVSHAFKCTSAHLCAAAVLQQRLCLELHKLRWHLDVVALTCTHLNPMSHSKHILARSWLLYSCCLRFQLDATNHLSWSEFVAGHR